MKTFRYLGTLLTCAILSGCGGMMGSSTPPRPAPLSPGPHVATNDVMRVGDKITIRLSGVPDNGYFNEVQIPDSGQVTVDLLNGSFQAAGRTTSELAADITAAYKGQKIYTNPIITVIPEERFVNVSGDVRSPSRVAFTSDLTVLSAITSCGGFDEYANKHAVRLIRGQQVMYIDCVAAAKTPGADPAVYPGDQITVPRTMF